MKPGDVVNCVIDGVDDEGRGRATAGPWDLAVRGAFPGDVVTARVERVFEQRGLAQCGAVDVDCGSLHTGGACEHKAPCPGCPLEDVDAGFALALKRERVVGALREVGLERVDVADVVPSMAPRQKVKLTAGGVAGDIKLGLFVPYSHDLRDASRCPHQDPRIVDVLAALKPILDATAIPPATVDKNGIKAVIARVFAEGVGVVVVAGRAIDDAAWALLSAAPSAAMAVRVDEERTNSLVGGNVVRSRGPQLLTPLEGGPPASVDAFCQSDPLLASWMYERAAAFVVDGGGVYADLYAGAGGFTRALLNAGAERVVAVERAAEGAKTLALLGPNVDAVCAAVETAQLPSSLRGLVVDPPKSGLRDSAAKVAAMNVPRVVLVACDPDAGARDARVFVDAGYTVVDVTPLDLFPATPEVETVFLLRRSSSSR